MPAGKRTAKRGRSPRKKPGKKRGSKGAQVLFADIHAKRLEPKLTLVAKFERLLGRYDLKKMFGGKRTAVKMHLGNNIGFTTIHPIFVSTLVDKLKEAGADPFVTDMGFNAKAATRRGYTKEVLGCPVIPACGLSDNYFVERKTGAKLLPSVDIAGEIVEAEAMVDLSHAKGHGNTAFGGACKNLSMGAVSGRTRRDVHRLEGGIKWDKVKCVSCGKCVEACERNALSMNDDGTINIFVHNCAYCSHCVLVCPKGAIRLTDRDIDSFQKGMALSTREVLRTFEPGHVLYVNVLLNITIFCDCWGMSTPQLVPDIGIMVSDDIVAVELATLDAIKTENLIDRPLPGGYKLGEGEHLFQKLHGKDPYVQIRELAKLKLGSSKYEVKEVH